MATVRGKIQPVFVNSSDCHTRLGVKKRTDSGGKNLLAFIDKEEQFVHGSCMGKTITIDDEAYKLLSELKHGPRDSFSQVIHRHIRRKANTCGELLDLTESKPPPNVDLDILARIERERGRRSGGRR